MVPSDIIPSVMNYANSCTALKAAPTCEQVRAGVIPLDSLPAAWWNCMWYDTNKAVNCTRYSLTSIIQEINSVLAAAGKQVDQCCVNQLYESIETIRQTVGNSICAGAVKSSSTDGQISISASGIMTVNGVGNAALLTTSSHTVTNAINELKQVYTGCFNTLAINTDTVDNIKANTMHTVTQTSYGVGNAADYGHLKISDVYDTDLDLSGTAASQKAVSDMYNHFFSMTGGMRQCARYLYTRCMSIVSSDIWCCGQNYYILLSNTSGYAIPQAHPALKLGNFLTFPEGSVCYQRAIDSTKFCTTYLCSKYICFCGHHGQSTTNQCLCRYISGHPYHSYYTDFDWSGRDAVYVAYDYPRYCDCCRIGINIDYLCCDEIVPTRYGMEWCYGWKNCGCNTTRRESTSVLYGAIQCSALYTTAYKSCRTGAMAYTFWNNAIIPVPVCGSCRSASVDTRWRINGTQMCPLAACCQIGRGSSTLVRANDYNCWFPTYNTVPWTMHVHFNVLVQSDSVFCKAPNSNMLCPITLTNPSTTFLGFNAVVPFARADAQMSNALRCAQMCYRVNWGGDTCYVGCDIYSYNLFNDPPSDNSDGQSPTGVSPYGFHLHHYFNIGCDSLKWADCFAASAKCCYNRYKGGTLAVWFASQTEGNCKTVCADWSCYYGNNVQPPIYKFYIEE